MKRILLCALLLTIFFISFRGFVKSSVNPENAIKGSWKEVSWAYEKVDQKKSTSEHPREGLTKNSIKQDLIIHAAENWHFLPDGTLILECRGRMRVVKWCLKGRGHILQLKYDNDTEEQYQLNRIGDNEMVLNFETEVQARGIAKLTFKRI